MHFKYSKASSSELRQKNSGYMLSKLLETKPERFRGQWSLWFGVKDAFCSHGESSQEYDQNKVSQIPENMSTFIWGGGVPHAFIPRRQSMTEAR